jgi:hypothetical protein
MIRKLLMVAAAIALPVSVVAVSGEIAGASNGHAGSASTDTITCTKITGTVSFSPKLTLKGYTSGSTTTTVKATVSGCRVKGTFADKVTSGTMTGTIKGSAGTATSPSGTCAGLTRSNSVTGALSARWKATPGVPSSVLTLKSITGAIKSNHGTFTIPGSIKGSAAGPFEGTNRGASDKTVAQTTETATQLATACATGISSLAIGTEPGVAPVSLG